MSNWQSYSRASLVIPKCMKLGNDRSKLAPEISKGNDVRMHLTLSIEN